MPIEYNQINRFTLFEATGRVVAVHCRGYDGRVNYLATDLVPLRGLMHSAWDPPFPCPCCKTSERMKVWFIPRRISIFGTGRWQTVARPLSGEGHA
jgi:hypothetical protein